MSATPTTDPVPGLTPRSAPAVTTGPPPGPAVPTMDFGLNLMLPCAPHQSPVARYRDAVEQAVEAEALGFESVWPVEQHFDAATSISPSPILLLASVAARTSTLRLGTGVVVLPLHHPVRVAEDIATLDVLSGGRVEVGVGRGTDPSHFDGLGVDQAESRSRLLEGITVMQQAWGDRPVTFTGHHVSLSGVSVVPKPVQRPHPPIRVAANSQETLEHMGTLGHDVLVAGHVNPLTRLAELLPAHRRARVDAGHDPAPGRDVTLLLPLFVGESAADIRRDLQPSVEHLLRVVRAKLDALVVGQARDASTEAQARFATIAAGFRRMSFDAMRADMAVFDTPEASVERLRWIRDVLGVGRVICWFDPGGLVPQERVLRSMRLFAEEVVPRLAADGRRRGSEVLSRGGSRT